MRVDVETVDVLAKRKRHPVARGIVSMHIEVDRAHLRDVNVRLDEPRKMREALVAVVIVDADSGSRIVVGSLEYFGDG